MLPALLLPLLAFLVLACTGGTPETADPDGADDGPGTTVIYLSRHAEKAGGEDPGLLPAGEDRARRLAAKLPTDRIRAVYATGLRRTQATAAPTAQRAGVPVRDYSFSAAAGTLTEGWLREHRGQTILVVGHSNTVPDLLNALVGERRYSNIAEDNYGLLYKVSVNARGRARVREMTSD